MATLQGAVPGWPAGRPLTSAATRAEARAVLNAESRTSVLDPRGLRRLWWREVFFVAALVLLAAWVLVTVQYFRSGELPAWWRWHRDLRLQPSVVAPAADWPAGSEAYALLSGAASVQSVAPTWLGEQVGLPPAIGASWIDLLTREGWLTGGGHVLWSSRLPERHVVVTHAGREELEAERIRLRALTGF